MPLSDLACKSAEPRDKDYKIADGNGLYLLVKTNGTKCWRKKYRFGGREKTLAFGVYPDVSLKRARERRMDAESLLADGVDPGLKKKKDALLREIEQEATFETVAREWHRRCANSWSSNTASKVLSVLERDLFPFLGSYPIKDIDAPELLATLRKVESRGALDALADTRSYAGRIFRYGIATGRADRDVAADLRGAFPRNVTRHLAALPYGELPDFLAALGELKEASPRNLALRLVILTLTRTTEVRGARLEEFDPKRRLWIIPAERMKMRRDHVVPLSDQALALFEEIKKRSANEEYLFPGAGRKSPTMSENAMLYLLRDMGYKGRATVHGFRTVGSTILHESGKFRSLVIERQLAHVDGNAVRASYNRAEYLDERCEMMQWWADHLDVLRTEAGAAQ